MDLDPLEDEAPPLVEATPDGETPTTAISENQLESGLGDLSVTKVPITIITGSCGT